VVFRTHSLIIRLTPSLVALLWPVAMNAEFFGLPAVESERRGVVDDDHGRGRPVRTAAR
jgi:hypothetical protein